MTSPCKSPPVALTASPSHSLQSFVTYTSTATSDHAVEPPSPSDRNYYVPEPPLDTSWTSIPPATSQEFAALFPSSRRLRIRHDDSTVDGNMNLRVDTVVRPADGAAYDTQLFHLRMQDLKSRTFSLRRYCRDSNREICHCTRRVSARATPILQKPRLQRSLSKTLNIFKHRNDPKASNVSLAVPRQDSGYGSQDELDVPPEMQQPKAAEVLSDHMTIDFSNYAHSELRRRVQGNATRYEFEYWGCSYAWKRATGKGRQSSAHFSFRLFRKGSSESIAQLVQVPLSAIHAQQEAEKGGWIPPSLLWISDQATIDGAADVCDAIVATGLMCLVDDCIHRTFHSKRSRRLIVPLPTLTDLKANKDFVDPHQLVDEIFHRRNSAAQVGGRQRARE